MLTLITLALLQAAPFEGTYKADQGLVKLTQKKGEVRGSIILGNERVSLRGKINKGVLVGQAIDGYRKHFTFRATLVEGVLSVTIQTDTIDFIREQTAAASGSARTKSRGRPVPSA